MTDKQKWVSVFKSTNKVDAEIIRVHLDNEGIPAVIINKQDSSYMMILPGMAEVHVPESFQEQASNIINNTQQSTTESTTEE